MKSKPASAAPTAVLSPCVISFENKRDTYGFALRPQHVQRYRQYANIYQEEEEERSDRWKDFLERQVESAQLSSEEEKKASHVEATDQEANLTSENGMDGDDLCNKKKPSSEGSTEDVKKENVPVTMRMKTHRVQIWSEIRPSLHGIEDMMSIRVKKKSSLAENVKDTGIGKLFPPVDEVKSAKGGSEEESEEEFYDAERSDPTQEVPSNDSVNTLEPSAAAAADAAPQEFLFPWKEELECLVRGGVPMALRGELWQAFVGVRARRVEKYYQDLLGAETNSIDSVEQQSLLSDNSFKASYTDSVSVPEKWKGQIEKDLPRTFPGHPALDEDGRNALRRLLTAYARHKPSVGYCQAMNFFAGLLLLMMPEENAFWALMGILDDYFDGYYSEEMLTNLFLRSWCARDFLNWSIIWITLECRWHGLLDPGFCRFL